MQIRVHNAFKTGNPNILEKERYIMAVDFPVKAIHGGTGKRQREKPGKTCWISARAQIRSRQTSTRSGTSICLSITRDDFYAELKERIGTIFHRDIEEICVGNGSIELIRVICSVVFRNRIGRNRFYLQSPTFGEYELSARLSGATPAVIPSDAGVYFLCNPNNPTGLLMKKEKTQTLLDEVKRHKGMLFCDEAFIELSDPRPECGGHL